MEVMFRVSEASSEEGLQLAPESPGLLRHSPWEPSYQTKRSPSYMDRARAGGPVGSPSRAPSLQRQLPAMGVRHLGHPAQMSLQMPAIPITVWLPLYK